MGKVDESKIVGTLVLLEEVNIAAVNQTAQKKQHLLQNSLWLTPNFRVANRLEEKFLGLPTPADAIC